MPVAKNITMNNANWNQLSTWEDPHGRVCKYNGQITTENTGFDRHAKVTNQKDVAQASAGRSNYVFADGHAKNLSWGDTWKRIGDNTTSAGKKVYPTMWRQLYNDVSAEQCDYPDAN